jgi:hypothetical protein
MGLASVPLVGVTLPWSAPHRDSFSQEPMALSGHENLRTPGIYVSTDFPVWPPPRRRLTPASGVVRHGVPRGLARMGGMHGSFLRQVTSCQTDWLIS